MDETTTVFWEPISCKRKESNSQCCGRQQFWRKKFPREWFIKRFEKKSQLASRSHSVLYFYFYPCAEWQERKLYELKALKSKRNSDDCAAKNNSCRQISNRKLKTAKDSPKNVQQEWACFCSKQNIFSEWKERNAGQLKALNSHWNADNCNAPNQANC